MLRGFLDERTCLALHARFVLRSPDKGESNSGCSPTAGSSCVGIKSLVRPFSSKLQKSLLCNLTLFKLSQTPYEDVLRS